MLVRARASGERVVATVRLSLVLALTVLGLALGPRTDGWILAVAGLVAVGYSVILFWLAFQVRQGWVPWLSCAADVTMISGALLFLLRFWDSPIAVTNSRTFYDLYFLAIMNAGLRYDWRLCVWTSLLAAAEYVGLTMLAVRELPPGGAVDVLYGSFSWQSQWLPGGAAAHRRGHHVGGGVPGPQPPADGGGRPPDRSVAAGAVHRAHRRGAEPVAPAGLSDERGHPRHRRIQGLQRRLRAPQRGPGAADRLRLPALLGAQERPGGPLRRRGVRHRLPRDRGGAGHCPHGGDPRGDRPAADPGGEGRPPAHRQRRHGELAGRRGHLRGGAGPGRHPALRRQAPGSEPGGGPASGRGGASTWRRSPS